MRAANLLQSQDDSWTLEITHDSGLTEVLMLGRLGKEQAQREAVDRVRAEIVVKCFDKDVMKAIQEGRLVGIV